jgi:hypothetical protein
LHVRGSNISGLETILGQKLDLENFDAAMEIKFHTILAKYGLKGRLWREYKSGHSFKEAS